MVKFFKPGKKEVSPKHFFLKITGADIAGRGFGRDENGTAWFVPGALPGEEVVVRASAVRRNAGEAELIGVKKRSPIRVEPACPNVSCGGCSLRHVPVAAEIAFKKEGLVRLMRKNLNADPGEPEETVYGSPTGYRRAARLSVTGDRREIRVGFREERGKKLAEIAACPVMHPDLSALIPGIRETLRGISDYKLIGHVELARADNVPAVLFRCINDLTEADLAGLAAFGARAGAAVYVLTRHARGKEDLEDREELRLLNPGILGGEDGIYYEAGGIRFYFTPGDFIQVNAEINAPLVKKVLSYLDLKPGDRIADFFCGLGNFTLPAAARCAHAYGVEGVWNMVREAELNASRNNIGNAEFFVQDLNDDFAGTVWARSAFGKAVLDPGRAGAARVMDFLTRKRPERIVSVSCNPLTMVGDLGIALGRGYKIEKWSVFDMFPQTEHVETVMLLTRTGA